MVRPRRRAAGFDLQHTLRAELNFAVESDDAVMLSQIGCLETLIRYDEVSGELKPLLASEWSQTEPLAWDVTLRDDVTFQNGTRLTAETVATALNYVLGTDAPPRAFSPSVVSSVEVVDEDTVRVVTPEESALLPYRLASVNTGILAPEAYTDAGTDPMGTCTGPFAITDYAPGQSLRLEPNTDYWGGDVPLDRVEVQFIPEGTARATQIQTGEADIAGFLPATSIADVEADSEVTVTRTFTPRTTGLHFNTSRPPFDDPNVRRAVQVVDLDAPSGTVRTQIEVTVDRQVRVSAPRGRVGLVLEVGEVGGRRCEVHCAPSRGRGVITYPLTSSRCSPVRGSSVHP
ncbi:ABC transporter substrate-binding protein [Georgenia sp. SUBG003]|uniref:ABC transporter substrate-binding protein n=1 Tax=Georgenia sp. SUBG003 TaxID=1497974 RepID=UPI003AB364FA